MARGLYRRLCRCMTLVEPTTRAGARVLRARRRSSACSSRTSRAAGSAASPRSRRAAGDLAALCHVGANIVPSGERLRRVRRTPRGRALAHDHRRERRGVGALGGGARRVCRPREDRPGQPVYAIDEPPPRRATPGCGRRRQRTSTGSCPPAPRRTSWSSASIRSARDAEGFRWRTRAQIEEGRSWLWLEDGVVRFKAEASAWTPSAVQLQQVWVDPPARGRGYAARGLRDLCRLLLATSRRP